MADTNPYADPNLGADLVPANPYANPDLGKPRGMVNAFGAGVKETAGEAAQAVGAKTGLTGIEQWGKKTRAEAAPTGEESLPASTARALGGLAGWLPAIVGTAALIPAAPEAAAGTLLGAGITAASAALSMAVPAAVTKYTTSADLREKGVDESTAEKSGWTAAATTAAGGVVPLAKAGGVLTRLVSGGASQTAFGEVNRELQNKILEQHPDLQSEFSTKNAITNFAVGAAMGTILGPSKTKADIAAAKLQAEADLKAGEPTAPPAPAPAPEVRPPLELTPSGMTPSEEVVHPTLEPNAAQGALQFAPAAPEAPVKSAFADKLDAAVKRNQMDQTFAQSEAGKEELKSIESAKAWNIKAAQDQYEAATSGKELPVALPNRSALEGIAAAVKEEGTKIPRQDLAKILRSATSGEDLAVKLRETADAWDEAGKRTKDAGTLNAIAAHLSERPKFNLEPSGEVAAKAEPVAAKAEANPKQGAIALPDVTPVARGGFEPFMDAQAKVLESEAHTRGYANADEFGAKDPKGFAEVAKAYSEQNSREVPPAIPVKPVEKAAPAKWDLAAEMERAEKSADDVLAQRKAVTGRDFEDNIPKKTPLQQHEDRTARIDALIAEAHRLGNEGDIQGANITARRAQIEAIDGGADYQQHLSDKASKAFADGEFSSKTPENLLRLTRHTPESLEKSVLAAHTGVEKKAIQALIDSGKLEIITKAQYERVVGQKINDVLGETTQGRFMPSTGKSYLLADGIERDLTKSDLHGLVAHEVVVHAMHLGKNEVAFNKILEGVDALRAAGDAQVQTAFERVPAGTAPDRVTHEALAYLVQHAPQLPMVKRFIAMIRNAIRSLGDSLPAVQKSVVGKWADTLDTNDLLYMAQTTLKEAYKGMGNPPLKAPTPKVKTVKEGPPDAWDSTTSDNQYRKGVAAAMGAVKNTEGLGPKDVYQVAYAAAAEHVGDNDAYQIAYRLAQDIGKKEHPWSSVAAIKSVDFQAGPQQAVKAATEVLSKAASLWDSLKPSFQKQHLHWTQMTHIADITEHLIPMLPQWGKDAVSPIRDKINSLLSSGAMAKELNHKAQGVYDQWQLLAPKQKEAMVALAGKYQLAKIFPDKGLEEHGHLMVKGEVPAESRRMYNEAKQLYEQPGVAKVYDAARTHNQLLQDTGMASLLKSMGQIYGVPETLWRPIKATDGMGPEVKALLDRVAQSKDVNLHDQFSAAMALHEAKKQESYFSLGRDGDFMVNFHVKDTPEAHAAVQAALSEAGVKDNIVVNPGDTHVFSMFDTSNQLLSVTKQLDKLQAAGHLDGAYTGGKAVEKLKALDSSAPSFIRGMLAKIDEDVHLTTPQKGEQQELLRRMYINMLPESSASKFYARRAGTPGYSTDMARSFVKRAAAGAYFTAQHATRPEQNVAMSRLRESIAEMGKSDSVHFDLARQEKAVNVLNELNQRTADILTPLNTPMTDAMGAIGHTFFLSASPGFILQNLAQPYQLTLPYLGGRHGYRASSVEMGSAAKAVGAILKDTIQQGWQNGKWNGVLDATITVDRAKLGATDKEALKYLISSGRADWTQGGELSKIAEGSNRALEIALKSANLMSYYGEAMNRMQTGLAAFRLELKKTGDKQKALDYMVKAVDDTQINYAPENRARAIGKHGVFGTMTPLVMAFQQYNIGVLQLLGKLTMQATRSGAPAAERMEAVKSLGGLMATTGAMAGTMGLPFAGIVMSAYNNFMGSEDSPVDAKSDYQNWLTDSFGQDAAQIIAHGAANYLSGADVAGKLGQENVLPFTGLADRLLDKRQALKDKIGAGALQFMGPVVNGGVGVLEGLGQIADGNMTKGLEHMSPAATKGIIKSIDLENNGFTDSKGNKLPMEATNWDATVQGLGFRPTKLAMQQEANSGVSSINNAIKMRQQALGNQFADAVESHDVQARMKVMDEAKAFMQANPGIKVDFAGAVRNRAKDAALAKATGTGVGGRAQRLPFVEQQTRFNKQQP